MLDMVKETNLKTEREREEARESELGEARVERRDRELTDPEQRDGSALLMRKWVREHDRSLREPEEGRAETE